ncbi:MAG: radical SAM protein [Candidatus Lokiarchaeota archaeon]
MGIFPLFLFNFLNPEDLINTALARQCEGTSISFNEPTLLFEYSLKVFKLAKKKNLYNTYVSNGYMTEMVLKDLKEKGLDAINIDIKGNNEIVKKHCGIDNEKVWRNAELAKNLGIHVEITTLLIEGLNSDLRTIETIAKRIENNLGSDTPYHISRFFPKYKAKVKGYTKATSLNLLYKSYDIASKFLNFVYIGNIFDPKYNTTFCPNCLQKVITRSGLSVSEKRLDTQGNCSYCGTKICVQ